MVDEFIEIRYNISVTTWVVLITKKMVKIMYEIGLPEFEVLGRITNQDNDYVYTVVPKSRMWF